MSLRTYRSVPTDGMPRHLDVRSNDEPLWCVRNNDCWELVRFGQRQFAGVESVDIWKCDVDRASRPTNLDGNTSNPLGIHHRFCRWPAKRRSGQLRGRQGRIWKVIAMVDQVANVRQAVVAGLRQMALRDAEPSKMVEWLRHELDSTEVLEVIHCFRDAFGLTVAEVKPIAGLTRSDDRSVADAVLLNELLAPAIDARREQWQHLA